MTQWTVILAATMPNGFVSDTYETTVEADNVGEAFDEALKLQDWNSKDGGFLVSRLTSAIEDRVVVHDNNDPGKCWLSGGEAISDLLDKITPDLSRVREGLPDADDLATNYPPEFAAATIALAVAAMNFYSVGGRYLKR